MPSKNVTGEQTELRRVNWEGSGDARVEGCPLGENVKVRVEVKNEDSGEMEKKTKNVRMRELVFCGGCTRFRAILDDAGRVTNTVQKTVGTNRVDRAGMISCAVVAEEPPADPTLQGQIDKAKKKPGGGTKGKGGKGGTS